MPDFIRSESRVTAPLSLYFAMTIAIIIGLGTGCRDSAWGKEPRYVGTKVCAECHEGPYNNFTQFAKKANSFKAVEKMKDGLTNDELRQCYTCHTTGYNKPGGFVSEEKTPDMKNTGCEVCHGPGSIHAESGDPNDIKGKGKMDLTICKQCHTDEKVAAFNFKPLLHGGAH